MRTRSDNVLWSLASEPANEVRIDRELAAHCSLLVVWRFGRARGPVRRHDGIQAQEDQVLLPPDLEQRGVGDLQPDGDRNLHREEQRKTDVHPSACSFAHERRAKYMISAITTTTARIHHRYIDSPP